MKSAWTLARYIGVQVIAYGIDLGVFFALVEGQIAGPVIANLCAKLMAGLFAFCLHRAFTFRVQGAEGRAGHAAKYFALLALNAPMCSAILAGLMLFVTSVAVAKVLSDVIAVGVTFLVTKHVVFAQPKSAQVAAAPREPGP